MVVTLKLGGLLGDCQINVTGMIVKLLLKNTPKSYQYRDRGVTSRLKGHH